MPANGMPLFCFKNEILKFGIEVKAFFVKAFYNIGSEKNWIFSAMDQSKGTINVCLMNKKIPKTVKKLPITLLQLSNYC